MLKVIYVIIIGYILFKAYKFLKSIFTSISAQKEAEKVHGTSNKKTKIDKKDVIDAQFEEIDTKENNSSN